MALSADALFIAFVKSRDFMKSYRYMNFLTIMLKLTALPEKNITENNVMYNGRRIL